jgi:NAD(P)-dependent dehydrogenase (short-subunit alcohol dehydrogenase family)
MSTLDLFKLDGKVALVTGASRGLGVEMAQALVDAGAEVAVTSRNRESIIPIAEQLSVGGRAALPVVADVTDKADVMRMVEEVIAKFGRLDILVNNAGVNIRKEFADYEIEEWEHIIDTNVIGVLSCCQAVLPQMRKQQSGRIINIGSIMGDVALPTRIPYAASKGAVHQITKGLCQEVAADGITVNSIAPGPFMTEMNKAVIDQPEVYNFFLSRIPLGRWAEPKELRGVTLFLASEASSYVTGSTIYVDGGWTSH